MYHPTGRVLTVLELLQSRPGLSGRQLASRLETDVRTVRRYVAKLQDVGIPVESSPGRYGGYALRPGYKLPPLIFDEHEAAAIVLGLLGSQWLEIAQRPAAVDGALSKITRVLPEATRRRVIALSSAMSLSSTNDETRPNASLVILLSDCINRRQPVDLDYISESEERTHRTVEPYGLVGRQGKWYLVGFCKLRADYRVFRVDRVVKAAPRKDTFVPNARFDFRAHALEYLENRKAKWRLKVVFKAPLKTARTRIPASFGSLTEVPGGVRLEWPVNDLDYGARYLVGRGIPFMVEDPPELRATLRRIAKEISRLATATPAVSPRRDRSRNPGVVAVGRRKAAAR